MWTDAFTWMRAGEAMRTIGLEWEQSPHRLTSLMEVVRDRRKGDPEFDVRVRAAIAAWPEAEPDMALRQKALVAELEPA
ncbi:hypothetical protein LJD47_31645, partial [Escherichia coli]|nr:hypothetical protein [Escherichia coli]